MTDTAHLNRRRFLMAASAAGLIAGPAGATTIVGRRGRGGILAFPEDRSPVLDIRGMIDQPVIIREVQHLRHSKRTFFMRVLAENGAAGVIKCNGRMRDAAGLFYRRVRPGLIGTDARDIEQTFETLYRGRGKRGYKYAALAYYTGVGHAELAIWDLLGRVAGKRVADLIGTPRTERVPVYLSRLTRETTPEEETEIVARTVAETGGRAVKLKIGGRMSLNRDAMPGRTDRLVPMMRAALGDDMVIYVDANGSYDAPTAIEVGRMLEDNGVTLYEEPCPWEDFEMTKQVADALDVPVAGGEQDSSLPKWRWMIENRGVDIVQPDLIYNGGILRTLKVARMAEAAGIRMTPHYPRNGGEAAPLIHFASALPNFSGYMEYRAHTPRFDFDYTPIIEVTDGTVPLPPGPGFGIEFDPAIFDKAEVLGT